MSTKINGVQREFGKGIEFMLDYNLIDVYGLVGLNERFDVIKTQAGRAEVSISPIEDGIMASKLHDHAKLTAYQDKYSFDTKYQGFKRKRIQGKKVCGDKYTISLKKLEEQAQNRSTDDVHYETLDDIGKVGGFVPVPLGRGMYEWVAVIDFHKFYPNMIKTTNAGIASAIDVDKEYWFCVVDKNGEIYDRKDLIETPIAYFRKDIKALNAIIFDRWLKLRKEAQRKAKQYKKKYKTTKTDEYKLLDNKQFNIKTFTNAGFGVFGLPIDRNYSELVFNSCTISCQDVIQYCIEKVGEYGWKVIGGDTDSIFLNLKADNLDDALKEVQKVNDKLNKDIDKYLREVYNIYNNTIEIALETISNKFYVDTKKRYLKYNVYDEERLDKVELEIKGMDLKKRATSQLAADVQENLAEIMRNDNPLPKIKEYLYDVDQQLEEMKWSYVCKHGPLNKHLEEYEHSTEAARSARNSLKYMERYYQPGSNPYLGVFKKYPSSYNGKFITTYNGEFKMSFNKEDERELKEAGFRIDWDDIRRSQIHLKTKHILGVFGTSFYNIIEEKSMGDFLDI